MNIKQLLEYGINLLKVSKIKEPVLKSKILLSSILKHDKEYLIINEQRELNNDLINNYKNGITKLCNHIPLQYITNEQEFMQLKFYINESVLIPQPDTEILVEEVVNIINKDKKINILDLCTGSGAIGISILKNTQNCVMTLTDISREALKVAKKNYINIIGGNNSKNRIIESDLFEQLDKKNKFDIIVSNPPYIKSEIIKTLDLEVQKEPIIALKGGQNGLELYERIIGEAFKYLNLDGYLCLEIGYDQKIKVIDMIKGTNKYCNIYSKKDLAGNDRIVVCKKKEN